MNFIKQYILIFTFILISAMVCQGQAPSDKKAKKHYEYGVSFFTDGDFKGAMENFIIAENIDKEHAGIKYYLGACYCELKSYSKALSYLEDAKSKGCTIRELNFYLGRANHLTHNFKEAIPYYTAFQQQLKGSERNRVQELDNLIKNCHNGIKLIASPLEIKVKNLGPTVNSKFPDYNPVISADESMLYFTSRRDNSTGQMLHEDFHYYEDIYYSIKDTNWSSAEGVGSKINTESHDACIGLSADGQQMLIYKATSNGGDLFISNLDGKNWSSPKNLGPNINTPFWESSGSLSSDHKVLFFTSNKSGGVGGTDIYMTKMQGNGEYSTPILLGPQVNTPDDELSPFIHADGKTLYFSSRSYNSMGGFDIFSVEIDLETGEILSNPENIGYPINTADDDVYFTWSADNSRAYFSSVREGGNGEKDIYMLERSIALAPVVVWKGRVIDEMTLQPIEAKIEISDNSTQKSVGKFLPNKSSGKYIIALPTGRNYNIAVESENYSFFSKNLDVSSLNKYEEIDEDIYLRPLKKGTVIVLRNIFFNVNDASLRPESEIELTRVFNFLLKYPNIKLEVSGHSDSDGNRGYNMELSKKRAAAVAEYLIKKGIRADRLISNGYGPNKPIAPNDSPKNKQINRRTELMIVE
ncbi:OmpA family protein [Sporocytophaga myxococcoides]|uniref:OmpA family protein n=1 Tax=Sporocytophaga myxococcoides TaxID=153721 RepID=UPI0006845ACF|nr:OmpA family protein [Sporocytophaga myxococcoides]